MDVTNIAGYSEKPRPQRKIDLEAELVGGVAFHGRDDGRDSIQLRDPLLPHAFRDQRLCLQALADSGILGWTQSLIQNTLSNNR